MYTSVTSIYYLLNLITNASNGLYIYIYIYIFIYLFHHFASLTVYKQKIRDTHYAKVGNRRPQIDIF